MSQLKPTTAVNRRRALLITLGSVGALTSIRLLASAAGGADVGKSAPLFSVLDTENRLRQLTEFTGRAVVLEWTSPSFIVAANGTLAYAGGTGDKATTDPKEVRGSRNFVRAAWDDLAAGRRVATPTSRPFGKRNPTIRYC